MPLTEKTRKLLLKPFAISPVMRRFSLPGLPGLLLIAIGEWQQVYLLKVTGIILAAPIIWAYAVLLLVYFPILLFDSIRRSLSKLK